MKKLLIGTVAAVPLLLCGQAIAGGCNYGQHAKLADNDNKKELLAEELDPALLALWLEEQEKKEHALESSPILTYN